MEEQPGPSEANQQPEFVPVVETPPKKPKKVLLIVLGFVVLAAFVAGFWLLGSRGAKNNDQRPAANTITTTTTKKTSGLELDTSKNYGNKYANGLLPVGDNKYVTDTPKKGYVYLCHAPGGEAGGAGSRGPWFVNNNTQYDINKKLHIQGSVSWKGSYSMVVSGDKRVITTNDLPGSHTTGIFPVQPTDPAYAYDRNPNKIAAQNLTYSIAAKPSQLASPACMGGEVGVMTTGVALFNGFDAGGRDAGAWEIQDSCSGHPQVSSEYHYHTLSSCIKNADVKTVIGYALDGYPITGPKVGENNILTTDDLDECHGITSQITLDGKLVMTYHYVMTQDFPYSASCFRAAASQPPGQQQGGQNQQPKQPPRQP
jgi:hypothetical protein